MATLGTIGYSCADATQVIIGWKGQWGKGIQGKPRGGSWAWVPSIVQGNGPEGQGHRLRFAGEHLQDPQPLCALARQTELRKQGHPQGCPLSWVTWEPCGEGQ